MSKSFRQAFKATIMIGGASAISYLISAIQNKFAAVLLGPQGIALLGIFRNFSDLIVAISGMGLNPSGVKSLSEAGATDDQEKIAKTTTVLQYLIFGTASLGAFITLFLAKWLIKWSSGRELRLWEIILFALLVFVTSVGIGLNIQFQGRRFVSEISKIKVFSVYLGILLVIPCYYFFRINGILLALLSLALLNLLFACFYFKRLKIKQISISFREFWKTASHMISLGGCIMLGQAFALSCTYIQQSLICKKLSLDANGIFQAAFALSCVMIQFIASPLAADYFPSLVELYKKKQNLSHTVQDQIELSVLLGLPCIIGTMFFAPIIIKILYSSAFSEAVLLMRIIAYMVFIHLVCRSLVFVIFATGSGKTYLFTELFSAIAGVIFMWFGILFWQLPGTAIALSALQLAQFIGIGTFVYYKYSVKLSRQLIYLLAASILCITICFAISKIPNMYVSILLNLCLWASVSIYCIKRLCLKLALSLKDILNKIPIVSKMSNNTNNNN